MLAPKPRLKPIPKQTKSKNANTNVTANANTKANSNTFTKAKADAKSQCKPQRQSQCNAKARANADDIAKDKSKHELCQKNMYLLIKSKHNKLGFTLSIIPASSHCCTSWFLHRYQSVPCLFE